jgi:hypothetical protein
VAVFGINRAPSVGLTRHQTETKQRMQASHRQRLVVHLLQSIEVVVQDHVGLGMVDTVATHRTPLMSRPREMSRSLFG